MFYYECHIEKRILTLRFAKNPERIPPDNHKVSHHTITILHRF